MWEAYRNVSMQCEWLWPNVPPKQTNEKVPLQSLLRVLHASNWKTKLIHLCSTAKALSKIQCQLGDGSVDKAVGAQLWVR